ncbi:hypothetical protein RDI58_007091 [Solanum bulbocastanum]|uniref:Uncharacterized protein n=1 Tax=Solanum bulbocastanum TaxID=147425 RepID=A0AAN8TS60_SOLBU
MTIQLSLVSLIPE